MIHEFRKQLSKSLLGQVPQYLLSLSDATLISYFEVMNKYSYESVYSLNYAELIEEMLGALMPSIIEAHRNNEDAPKEDIEVLQKLNRMFCGAQFYKMVQDKSVDHETKVEFCHFVYKLLDTGAKMYGIDFMDKQKEFLHDVLEEKEAILALINTEHSPELPTFESHDLWKYTLPELDALAIRLKQDTLILDKEIFRQIFSKSWQVSASSCAWTGKITGLMFLFCLLFDDIEDKQSIYLKFISERFQFKDGRTKAIKNLREALRNIQDVTKLPHSSLQGEHKQIQAIYFEVFVNGNHSN